MSSHLARGRLSHLIPHSTLQLLLEPRELDLAHDVASVQFALSPRVLDGLLELEGVEARAEAVAHGLRLFGAVVVAKAEVRKAKLTPD